MWLASFNSGDYSNLHWKRPAKQNATPAGVSMYLPAGAACGQEGQRIESRNSRAEYPSCPSGRASETRGIVESGVETIQATAPTLDGLPQRS
jgi:hypothetical protein